MTLKVLTLNLWNRSGPYELRRPRIREWIERLAPDIIGFQEALRGEGGDQVADLLDVLGYECAYVKAVDFWEGQGQEFGNAVASRWPIRAPETLRLPDAGDAEHRAAIAVTIAAPFGDIGFTCTHLNWKLHHGFVREHQVVAVAALARARRPRDGFPPILVGDFNAVAESTEIRYIKGLHAIDGGSVHFRDAWAVAGEGDGITWSNRNDHARPALEPDRRIDFIFVGPPRRDGLGMIERCRVVCDDSEAGVWPSDHFGVYAELRTEPL